MKYYANRALDATGVGQWLQSKREQQVHTLTIGPATGLKFCTGPAEPGYATGNNEVPVQECIYETLRPGDVFYDVGANVGFMTVIAAHAVGTTGHVYAFEPIDANRTWIRRNVDLNKFDNVTIMHTAVSDHVGTDELIIAEYSGGSALSTVEKPPDAVGSMVVNVSTVDEISRRGARPPNLVKIDVEGAEIQVFDGMHHTLEKHRPVIICEVDGQDRSVVNAKLGELQTILDERDYEFRLLDDSYPENKWQVCHFLAKPKS